MKKNTLSQIAFILLGSLFFPTFITSLLYIFKIEITTCTYPISLVLLLITYYIVFYNKNEKKQFYVSLIISVLIIALCIGTCSIFIDNSWDGPAYHIPAIIKLSQGWNPIYEHIDDINILNIWSSHYPKFIWIYAANLYKIFKNFYIGASFGLIITISLFLVTFEIFKKLGKSNKYSLIISLIYSFNLIALSQFFTYYNDGIMGIIVLYLLMIFYALSKGIYKIENNYKILLMIGMLLSIIANLKYNGALIAFVYFIIFYIYFIFKKKILINKNILKGVFIIGSFVSIVSINTYLPNIINHHNIGYPIVGKNKIDIITGFVPHMIGDSNKIEAFIKTFTSYNWEKYTYNPFYIISQDAIDCASEQDCAINGFGPFYQSIIILLIILLLYQCIKIIIQFLNKKDEIKLKRILINNDYKFIILLLLGFLFIICPATWWVRYIPYFYSLPLIIIILFFEKLNKFNFQNIICILIISIYTISLPIYGNR